MLVEEASADVEADQIQEVTIESPDVDLVANNTLIPQLFSLANSNASMAKLCTGHFNAIFLAVEEENLGNTSQSSKFQQKDLSEHERQLLLEYKTKEALDSEEESFSSKSSTQKNSSNGGKQGKVAVPSKPPLTDSYEKVVPRHGDMGFHKFLSVIQKNPGHVLRYFQY